jgi:EAL domain-containing protein (putative c-di-GMP-specific phosphodiesterase class I)
LPLASGGGGTSGFRPAASAIDIMDQKKPAPSPIGSATKPAAVEPFTLAHLKESLEKFYLRVEYQPKVPFQPSENAVFGVEALCRIQHPDLGLITPDRFIALAEGAGLMTQLTDQVITQSFFDWRKWFDHGLSLKLALNISPGLLADSGWVEQFLARQTEYGIDPEYIVLEITETLPGAANLQALDVLQRLTLKGYMLSIDDFGTGFSSLSNLYKLPFGELKIDKSFTADFRNDAAARALVESTVSMARRLGIRVTVEGVDNDATFSELKLMGCDDAQGFLISKSIAADDVPGFFAAWSSDWERSRTAPKIAIVQTLLQEAMARNAPDATLVLSAAGKKKTGEEDIASLIRRIPAMALEGDSLGALAQCHKAIARLSASSEQLRLRKQLLELQRLLEEEILSREPVELVINGRRIRLLPGRAALIGRPSRARDVEVAIDCRWFSRGERSLYLFSDGERWSIEDLGSTNGNSIDDQRLVPGVPVKLDFGETLVDVGRAPGGRAPVTVHLNLSPTAPNAVRVTLSAAEKATDQEAAEWPSREQDLNQTWLIFREGLSLGAAPGCGLTLPGSHLSVAADLRFQNGFWIAPRAGASLMVNDIGFEAPVPIPAGARLRLADVAISLERPLRTVEGPRPNLAATGTDGDSG